MKTLHIQEAQLHRGITDRMLELITSFGVALPAKGDALLYELPRDFIEVVSKAMRCRVIVASGKEITTEWKTKGTKKRCKDHNDPCPSQPIRKKF